MALGFKRLARIVLFALPALAALAVIAACNRSIGINPAPIHEVDVRFAESYPVQVFVYIKGGLSDGCTVFHDLIVEREADTITITITTERPRNAVCPAVYGFFEKNVALGSGFIAGNSYILKVNDVTTTFVYPS